MSEILTLNNNKISNNNVFHNKNVNTNFDNFDKSNLNSKNEYSITEGNNNSKFIKKVTKGFKKVDNNTRVLAHDSLNYSPGHGLWCIQTDNKSGDTSEINQLINNHKSNTQKQELAKIKKFKNIKDKDKENKDLYPEWLDEENGLEMIDKKIIEKLKQRVHALTKQLQESMFKQNELEYKTTRAEEKTELYKEAVDLKISENEQLIDTIKSQNTTISGLNENISQLEQEISRYKEEINKLHEIIKVEKQKIDKIKEEFKQREDMFNEENHTLLTQLHKISTAKDDDSEKNETSAVSKSRGNSSIRKKNNTEGLRESNTDKSSKVQIKINQSQNENSSKNIKNISNKNPLDSNEFKLQLAIVDLREQIDKLECQNQNQYMNIKRKNEEILKLKKQVEEYAKYYNDYKALAKWNESGLNKKKAENELLKSQLQGMINQGQNPKIDFINSIKPLTLINSNRGSLNSLNLKYLNTNNV